MKEFLVFKVYDESNVILDGVGGNTIPSPVTTTTNKMIIRFTSDGSNEFLTPPNALSWKGTFTAV